MRRPVQFERPKLQRQPLHRAAGPRITVRPIAVVRPVVTALRVEAPVRARQLPAVYVPPSAPPPASPDNPYLDYSRSLTAEGGILIWYKDIDSRLRHTLWRLFAWSLFTGAEGFLLLAHSPFHAGATSIACLIVMAIINWLIVRKPVQVYRNVEIRPDCMILDGADLFWRRSMEGGWPSFKPDADGNLVLCGIYGTRWVQFLRIPRFDENDRAPDVLNGHLASAMRQLWTRLDV
jgi:hypothetical protein